MLGIVILIVLNFGKSYGIKCGELLQTSWETHWELGNMPKMH